MNDSVHFSDVFGGINHSVPTIDKKIVSREIPLIELFFVSHHSLHSTHHLLTEFRLELVRDAPLLAGFRTGAAHNSLSQNT